MLGVVNFFGMVFTFLVPESNGKSLEQMSGENEDDGGEAIEVARTARSACLMKISVQLSWLLLLLLSFLHDNLVFFFFCKMHDDVVDSCLFLRILTLYQIL